MGLVAHQDFRVVPVWEIDVREDFRAWRLKPRAMGGETALRRFRSSRYRPTLLQIARDISRRAAQNGGTGPPAASISPTRPLCILN